MANSESNNPAQPTDDVITWADFLASHPPDKERKVSGMGSHMKPRSENFVLSGPDLNLLCESDMCGGIRTFTCENAYQQTPYNHTSGKFLTYRCRNCKITSKQYALSVHWRFSPRAGTPCPPSANLQHDASPIDSMFARKFGEWPLLGPSLPKKLLNLIKSDRELFDAGRRAEGQGMGIGAFAYYRRVVENQRTQLFDKLIAAAIRLKVEAPTLQALESDRENWQFSQSVDCLKAVLPDSLNIGGQSPLALLHSALSHNLHAESDEVCLQAASDIRLVLESFAERLANVMKDEAELEKAVGRLTRPVKGGNAQKNSPPS